MQHIVDYPYGYQGSQKDNEIYSEGNAYTAMFWEYDARLGRRWNADPVVKEWESPYACFANNPIHFIDPTGSDTVVGTENGVPCVTLPEVLIYPRMEKAKPILNNINSRPIPATVLGIEFTITLPRYAISGVGGVIVKSLGRIFLWFSVAQIMAGDTRIKAPEEMKAEWKKRLSDLAKGEKNPNVGAEKVNETLNDLERLQKEAVKIKKGKVSEEWEPDESSKPSKQSRIHETSKTKNKVYTNLKHKNLE